MINIPGRVGTIHSRGRGASATAAAAWEPKECRDTVVSVYEDKGSRWPQIGGCWSSDWHARALCVYILGVRVRKGSRDREGGHKS